MNIHPEDSRAPFCVRVVVLNDPPAVAEGGSHGLEPVAEQRGAAVQCPGHHRLRYLVRLGLAAGSLRTNTRAEVGA
jgi:hypothetical protein